MNKNNKIVAIILAGGQSSRFGDEIPKQFLILHGRRVIDYSIRTFEENLRIYQIIIVTPEDWVKQIQKEYPDHNVVPGGVTRRASSFNGLKACPNDTKYVLIHDAARPFVDNKIIDNCIDALKTTDAVDTAIPASDTIIQIKNKKIHRMPPRKEMYQGQTPQAFKYNIILQAHEVIRGDTTDDIRLTKQLGVECIVVPGSEYNFKLTSQQDIYLGERISQIHQKADAQLSSFVGKKVLIFGGTGGIGSAIGAKLEKLGANVKKVGSEIDLGKRELPQHFNNTQWDIIIQSAGLFLRKPFVETNIEDWDSIISINLRSAFLVAHLAQQTMKKTGWLVFIGSSSSHRGRSEQSIYSASKAALNNLTQSLSEELLPLGIRVNCINPPRTNTAMRNREFPDENKSLLASPDEVAEDIIQYCQGNATGHIVNLKYQSQSMASRC